MCVKFSRTVIQALLMTGDERILDLSRELLILNFGDYMKEKVLGSAVTVLSGWLPAG